MHPAHVSNFKTSVWNLLIVKAPTSQLTFTCTKSTIEALEKNAKYVES